MSKFKIVALSTALVEKLKKNMKSPGYGHPATAEVATGHGPCRHCLEPFVVGEDRRILFTLNSFDGLEAIPQPGPVFVHEVSCERYRVDGGYPPALTRFGAVLDGYDRHHMLRRRDVVLDGAQESKLRIMFIDSTIHYIVVRDAEAGCYDFRVERSGDEDGAG